MIKITNLTKTFPGCVAIDNLSLEISDGIYGLVGQNGAGKSTLLRTISDVYKADSGSVTIDDYPNDSKEAKQLKFFLSDNPYYGSKTDDIKAVYNFYNTFYDINKENFDRLIKIFGLPLKKRVSTFSKGMQRQLFIAIALSAKVKYLLLDEAFDGLDPIILDTIKEEILKVREEGRVLVVSSHNISSLERLVDSFIIISKGKLGKEGEREHLGTNMLKFQGAFKKEFTQEALQELGIEVVSFKKVGSIFNFVIKETEDCEDKIRQKFDPIILDRVSIDPEEAVKLEMMALKGENNHE